MQKIWICRPEANPATLPAACFGHVQIYLDVLIGHAYVVEVPYVTNITGAKMGLQAS